MLFMSSSSEWYQFTRFYLISELTDWIARLKIIRLGQIIMNCVLCIFLVFNGWSRIRRVHGSVPNLEKQHQIPDCIQSSRMRGVFLPNFTYGHSGTRSCPFDDIKAFPCKHSPVSKLLKNFFRVLHVTIT